MLSFVRRLAKSRSGATAIEYGLIAALISIVIIAAVTLLGTNVQAKFNSVATGVGSAGSSS